jgi:hypothetical protein
MKKKPIEGAGVGEHKKCTQEPRPSLRSKGEEVVQVSRNSKARIPTIRRHSKFAWLFGATATLCALLYWEQTALLYLLSTLAMCGLLLIVAFSNLEDRDEELNDVTSEEAISSKGTKPGALASQQKRAA